MGKPSWKEALAAVTASLSLLSLAYYLCEYLAHWRGLLKAQIVHAASESAAAGSGRPAAGPGESGPGSTRADGSGEGARVSRRARARPTSS